MKLPFWFQFLSHNGLNPSRWRNFSPALLKVAAEYKYLHWPRELTPWIGGKSVTDIGCGRGLHGIGFILAGAASYTGLDPRTELDSDLIRDPRKFGGGNVHGCGWTPRGIMERVPAIRYRRGLIKDAASDSPADVVVLHNVTEHMMQIADDFARLPDLLKPGGRLIFRHPNFYAWNGHHMKPRTILQADPADVRQLPFLDWGHLTYRDDWPPAVKDSQNRIRLADLKKLVSRFFDIEIWRVKESTVQEGRERLTSEVLDRHPQFSQEELLSQSVFVVAKRRQ